MKNITTFLNEAKVSKGLATSAEYVDLDLPSGIKWATCNIGADKPEESGLLFQWGRTDGYEYDNDNIQFRKSEQNKADTGDAHIPATTSGTEYKVGDTLKPEDDAAYQATKGKFRMPTEKEIEELIKHTDNEWTKLNGVRGQKFISKKDDSKWIFIPAAGEFDGYYGRCKYEGTGRMWSASVYADREDRANNAYCLEFHGGYRDCGGAERRNGMSVRGVIDA